jgi:hypothetical protein
MLALHYQITLPADYDMQIIRTRVATRGHALDDYPGLAFKAYLIREAGIDGSPVNQYAPFYVWHDPDAMGRFLWGGDGFGGIVRDFGRPSAPTWIVLAAGQGPAGGSAPRFATRRTDTLPAFSDPQPTAEACRTQLAAKLTEPAVHSSVIAIDPRTWETVFFTLWDRTPPERQADRYEVLHLSRPTQP